MSIGNYQFFVSKEVVFVNNCMYCDITCQVEAMSNSETIKLVYLAIMTEGISQLVSQSVNRIFH